MSDKTKEEDVFEQLRKMTVKTTMADAIVSLEVILTHAQNIKEYLESRMPNKPGKSK